MGRMSDTIGNHNFTQKNRRLICFIDLKKSKKGEFTSDQKCQSFFAKFNKKSSFSRKKDGKYKVNVLY